MYSTGKRVVVVGGEPRLERVHKMALCLEAQSLEWISSSKTRQIQSLVSRMEQKTVDIVIVLQGLVSHKAADSIFAQKNQCDVVLAKSYGETQLKAAVERLEERKK